MSRPPANPTPELRIDRAAKWAEQQAFWNVVADLRQALRDLKQRWRRERP